jgi:hypothetical protein
MRNRHFSFLFLFVILISYSLSGQKLVNSPFSRFNLGSLEPAASFRSLAMGRTGTGFRDNNSIYFTNPASYSSLDTNSFIFDFGIDYGMNILKEGKNKFSSNDFNFDHLIMGFPLAKGWGFAAGIVNISNGYYQVAEKVRSTDPGYDEITGEYNSNHSGEGGFTNFFIGTGLNITKNLSAGINLTVLSGKVRRFNETEFADYYNVFHFTSSEKMQLAGANLNYGLQYSANFKNDYFFIAGASLNSGKNFKSDFESISYRYTAYGSRDTLEYFSDNKGSAFLPGTLKLGISAGKKDKFTIGFDFEETKWSNAEIQGSQGYLGDTRSFLFGVEFIPEKLSNYNFLKRLEYRAGVHFEDNYLMIGGQQVKEKGISAGIGIPMRRSLSKTNIFFDYTKKSGIVSHVENFVTFGISLNFYDYWFMKRKYD